uniref:Uncharacterized protein n=1 Tax=uncultured marine virus TaxID=186617 RepID=A0A0F7L964_9VIRU|nr:hypothetical protein [uncultured marine virus]
MPDHCSSLRSGLAASQCEPCAAHPSSSTPVGRAAVSDGSPAAKPGSDPATPPCEPGRHPAPTYEGNETEMGADPERPPDQRPWLPASCCHGFCVLEQRLARSQAPQRHHHDEMPSRQNGGTHARTSAWPDLPSEPCPSPLQQPDQTGSQCVICSDLPTDDGNKRGIRP